MSSIKAFQDFLKKYREEHKDELKGLSAAQMAKRAGVEYRKMKGVVSGGYMFQRLPEGITLDKIINDYKEKVGPEEFKKQYDAAPKFEYPKYKNENDYYKENMYLPSAIKHLHVKNDHQSFEEQEKEKTGVSLEDKKIAAEAERLKQDYLSHMDDPTLNNAIRGWLNARSALNSVGLISKHDANDANRKFWGKVLNVFSGSTETIGKIASLAAKVAPPLQVAAQVVSGVSAATKAVNNMLGLPENGSTLDLKEVAKFLNENKNNKFGIWDILSGQEKKQFLQHGFNPVRYIMSLARQPRNKGFSETQLERQLDEAYEEMKAYSGLDIPNKKWSYLNSKERAEIETLDSGSGKQKVKRKVVAAGKPSLVISK